MKTYKTLQTTIWMAFVALSGMSVLAQQPTQTAPPQPLLVQQVIYKTKTAKSIKDFADLIEICQNGEATATDNQKKYLRQMSSWAFNRRGEGLSRLATQQSTEGKSELAAQTDAAALSDFEKSITLDDGRWRALHNRGVSFALLGEYEKAIADFNATIRLRPDFPKVYFNRGEIRFELKAFEEAYRNYKEAIRLAPDDVAAYNKRGHSLYQLKRYPEAIADFSKAVEMAPENGEFLADRADALAGIGQFDAAANDYRQAIQLDKTLGRAYQSAAWLMATCPEEPFRNVTLALSAARKAIELDGDDDYLYVDTLAASLASAGEFDKATQAARRALALAVRDKIDEASIARIKSRQTLYSQRKAFRDIPRTAGVKSKPVR
jgi:tetratricopeptide (TPR) repeat protein